MKSPWFKKYLGMNWSEKFNCFDLAKLIYHNELGVDVSTELEAIKNPLDCNECSVAISEGIKNWSEVESPREFDLCIMGRKNIPHHIGVVINSTAIFHVNKGFPAAATFINPNVFVAYKLVKFYRHAINI